MGFKKQRYNAEESEHKIFPTEEVEETPEAPEVPEVKKEIVIEKPIEVLEEKPIVEDTERKLNCGITGDTLEVKEFRAIVKKQGKQINVVITKILNDWNQANYNL